jgi:hypothetical protein
VFIVGTLGFGLAAIFVTDHQTYGIIAVVLTFVSSVWVTVTTEPGFKSLMVDWWNYLGDKGGKLGGCLQVLFAVLVILVYLPALVYALKEYWTSINGH